MKLSPGLFKGRGERTRAPPKGKAFAAEASASLRKGLPRTPRALERKEDSSESSPRRGPVTSRCRITPTLQFRNVDRIPFRWLCLPFYKKKHFNPLGTRLGATHSCPIAVHTKPFSTSVYKGSTCIVATSTKICTRGPSTLAHAKASEGGPPRLPTHRAVAFDSVGAYKRAA